MSPIRIGRWFQGPTGSGQGGWTAYQLVREIGEPVTVAIRAPIPLDTDLHVAAEEDRWLLVEGTGPGRRPILEATRWDPDFSATTPLSIAAAHTARAGFPVDVENHPVPFCFSCGLQSDSMQVHAGPVGDGRFATDWRVPHWAAADGALAEGAIWAALDCTAAWFVSLSDGYRLAYTVQYTAEVTTPLIPGEDYALVGWRGAGPGGWAGRKRAAAAAAFSADGECVARASSIWIAVD